MSLEQIYFLIAFDLIGLTLIIIVILYQKHYLYLKESFLNLRVYVNPERVSREIQKYNNFLMSFNNSVGVFDKIKVK